MKRSSLLGLTIISCIGVIFAVIVSDDSEPIDNNIEEEEEVEISEFELDQLRVDELQLQYDEIIEYSCMEAKPQSYFEVKINERILEAEHRLRYLADQQSEMKNIKNEVIVLNEKYSESEPFTLYEWECVNQKFWVEEYPHLQNILDGN
jgi:hypothetical protein